MHFPNSICSGKPCWLFHDTFWMFLKRDENHMFYHRDFSPEKNTYGHSAIVTDDTYNSVWILVILCALLSSVSKHNQWNTISTFLNILLEHCNGPIQIYLHFCQPEQPAGALIRNMGFQDIFSSTKALSNVSQIDSFQWDFHIQY